MRRAWLLVVPIVALVLAWLLLRDADAPAPDVPALPAPAATASPEKTAPVERAPRPRARAGDEDTPATPPAAAKPQAPPSTKPIETIPESAAAGKLTVLDGETKKPLAAVRVGFMAFDPEHPPKEWAEENAGETDPLAWMAAHGRMLETDAEGRVTVPKFQVMALVAASHGDLQGIEPLNVGQTSWTLELRRPVALAAVVVGADGEPCGGVTVQIVMDSEWGTWPMETVESSATDGSARFDDVSRLANAGDGPISLTVALVAADAPKVAVDVAKPPAAPVRLVLPAMGRVRCEVVDESGAPVADGRAVLLRRFVEEEPRPQPRVIINDQKGGVGDARAATAAGAAAFAFVGLGLELEAEVLPTDASRSVKQRFAGPTRAGEETVVRVVLGGACPTIAGRLVDAAGAPVAGREVFGDLLEPGGRTTDRWHEGGGRCTTDDAGKFSFSFDREPGPSAGAKLQLGRRVSSGNSSSMRLIALVDLPAVLGAGVTDVGDVVFKGTGFLVAGVVVDPAGKPLAGATVRVMSDRESPDRDVDEAVTDAEGRFRISGEASSKRGVLGVGLDGWYVPERAAFAAGATDARVEMHPAGGIAGSVKVPEGVEPWRVQIRVQGGPDRNGDGEYRFDGGLRVSPDADGKFEVRTLRPGKARVVVQLGWNKSDTDVVVEGVEVVAGQVTRDPRLVDMDPAKGLREVTVTVVDAEKRPVPASQVHWRRPGSDESWEDKETGADGTAELRLRPGEASGVTVIATARGFRSSELKDVRADATLVLVPAKPVKLRVRYAADCPLPDPPFEIAVALKWTPPGARAATSSDDEDEDGDEFDWGHPCSLSGSHGDRFTKDRVVEFEAFDPGTYRVDLMLWKFEMNSGGGSGIATVPKRAVVTVVADSEPVEVTVGVDAEELRERMTKKRR